MDVINLRKFKKKFEANKRLFRYFITRTEKKMPANAETVAEDVDKEVWSQVDCLGCANCCKVMSPTYTREDIKRISAHLKVTPKIFKEKWLYLDKRDKDWMNKNRPCQFLDLKTNMCSIYEVRPADCAGFPHLTKKPIGDYFYVHKK